jgi:hypothetical protein
MVILYRAWKSTASRRFVCWQTRAVTVSEDRASDRRIAVAFGAVLVSEVVLATLADAGLYPLWAWLVLAVATVLVAGLAFAGVEARSEGTPVLGRRVRPPRE